MHFIIRPWLSCGVGVLLTLLSIASLAKGQQSPIKNVVLITLDGLRSEEVFDGADQRLMVAENGVKKPDELKALYWRESRDERRELLMPFLWKQCGTGQTSAKVQNSGAPSLQHAGWIAGDVQSESLVKVTNGLYFSYPGYNELLTGKPDPRVSSNDKKYNENVTVLEWLNSKPAFRGKVAAYTSWDVFPYIINDQRSGIPVNAGWQPFSVGDANRIAALNLVSEQLFHEWDGVRYDVLTTSGAIEELKTNRPRVLFVSLGETDDWAHMGRYDRYLLTAQQNDRFIHMLWDTCQELPEYQGKTLFIVTSDHGRGGGRDGWKNHGVLLPGSEHIWIAVFGPGLSVRGIDSQNNHTQSQIAATVAAAFGLDFQSSAADVQPSLKIFDTSAVPSK